MAETIIRKADLARLLGLSKSRVSQLCRLGLPVRKDGRLDRAAVLAWCSKYIGHPNNYRDYGKGASTPQRVQQALQGGGIAEDLEGFSDSLLEAYEAFRARISQVPEVLVEFNAPLWLQIASAELLDSAAGEVAAMVDREIGTELIPMDGPRAKRLPEPNRPEAVSPREWRAAVRKAARFMERVDELLFENGG